MKPFNLEEALAGKPVVTRDGREVSEIKFFETSRIYFKVLAVVDGYISSYSIYGSKYLHGSDVESGCDLFMKEETIKVNGFEVPKPESEALASRAKYFSPEFSNSDLYFEYHWGGDDFDFLYLSRGLVHLNKEAAIAHAKAMLGINPNKKEAK